MNRFGAALALILVAALPASAATITYTTSLSGPAEDPPNTSPGTGTAIVTVDDVLNTMRVQVSFAGLQGITSASHIHVINGPGDTNLADTNGPVVTTTPTFTGFPPAVMSGTYDQTFNLLAASSYNPGYVTAVGGLAAARLALLDGLEDERAYLNIHTGVPLPPLPQIGFSGGEIRGFLVPQQQSVPEPATLLLLGAAIGALGLRRARIRA